MKIIQEIEKCTGCCMCMLACSMERENAFNVRYSRVQVSLNLSGLPTRISFSDRCDELLQTQCTLHYGVAECVQFCLPKALKMAKEPSAESEGVS